MADSAEGAGFWLPSEFFDDFLMDKVNLDKNHSAESDSELCFPTEFLYDFETKSDEHLEKWWVMSTSPQSTLAHMGSWGARRAGGSSGGSPNEVPSPETTPPGSKNDAVEDLIYLAAGQVAKLELKGGNFLGPTKHKSFFDPTKGMLYPTAKSHNSSVIHNIYLQKQKQGCGMWYREPQMNQMRTGVAAVGVGQNAWHAQRNSRIAGTGARAVSFGGSFSGGGGGAGAGAGAAAKRECAGTGVFLPRRYGNNVCNFNSSDRRRPDGISRGEGNEILLAISEGNSAASIPTSNVHALNKNFDKMNGFAQCQPHSHPKSTRGLVPDCDLLMARRQAIMAQQRRSFLLEGSSPIDRVVFLPPEWTY